MLTSLKADLLKKRNILVREGTCYNQNSLGIPVSTVITEKSREVPLRIELSHDPVLLGMYLKKMKLASQRETTTLMLIWQHYSQEPRYGNNLSDHQQTNE